MSKKEPKPQARSAKETLITVLPLGRVEEDVLRVVADGLQGVLRLPVEVREGIPLPEEAFMSSRNQYNAMTLIKLLDADHSDTGLKVIGLTAKDITNPILTYVFGEAYMGGSAAVMSCARLRSGSAGELVNRERFLERVVKVAIHEIGHTFNIPHCHHGRCVMRVSNGLRELDDKLNYLCDYCELFLAEAVTAALKETEKDARRIETA